jgi:hypothetical protein
MEVRLIAGIHGSSCHEIGDAHRRIAGSMLELAMYRMRTELSGLSRFPVKFGAVPAMQNDDEVRPNKTADDYEEKPSHA